MILTIDTLLIAQDTLAAISSPQPNVNAVDSLVLSKQALIAIIQATKDEPSLTDWLQAGAAMFGTVIAGLALKYAFLSYRDTTKQQQAQIDDQQSQIGKLGAIAGRLEQQYRLDRKKRRQDIMPHFEDLGISVDGDYEPYCLELKNRGERAINLTLLVLDDAPIEFCGFRSNLILDKGDTIALRFRPIENTKSEGATMKFNLLFEDVDRNQYSQLISRDNNYNYTVNEPSLVNEVRPI